MMHPVAHRVLMLPHRVQSIAFTRCKGRLRRLELVERADRACDAFVEEWTRVSAQTPARRSMEAAELAAAFRRARSAPGADRQ
jgi:hypothetical protein